MTRKEELDIIIDNLRAKLISVISLSKDKPISAFVNNYKSIDDLNIKIKEYSEEYKAL